MPPCSVTIVPEPLGTYCRYAPLAVIGHWLQQTQFLAPLWSPVDGRGAMEVEIRADKQGLSLPRRRKHRLAAQMLLILLTDVAHNLLSWLHAAILADGPCADFGTLRLVQDLLCIPGRLEYEGAELQKVALLDTHPYAAVMAAALTKLLRQPTIP